MAIQLRLSGKSYSEIKRRLAISKSTLSLWLRDYPLTRTQVASLVGRFKVRQIENFRITMQNKKETKLLRIYNEAKQNLLPLTNKELLIAGLFLYLGEGSKQNPAHVLLSNTDPNIVKFTLYWYTKVLKIPKDKIKVNLQLYYDMDTNKEINYWSDLLGIPLSNFWKPYIKKSITKDIDHSGFKHGTCGLYFGSVPLHDKIMMSIKCILDKTN